MIAADLPPVHSLFPCQVQISVNAPGWETEIQTAIGWYSMLSGTTFTTGNGGIHVTVKTLPIINGVQSMGTWQGETISLPVSGNLPHAAKLRIMLHELGHAYWQPHNNEVDSVMYPTINPEHTVDRLSQADKTRIASAGCTDYR